MKDGFTLLELVVVTILIAILVSFASPQFRNSFHRLQLITCSQELAALSRFAHSQAVVDQQPILLRVDPDAQAAWLLIEKTSVSGEPTWEPYPPGRKVTIPQGIEVPSGRAEIIFSQDGQAYQTDGQVATVQVELKGRDGATRHLLIRGPSSRVELEESPHS